MPRGKPRETDCGTCERKAGEPLNTHCLECRNDAQIRWRAANPGRQNELQRGYNRRVRAGVITAYGGKCTCCDERRVEFLSIEHLKGDGAEHRRKLGGSGGMSVYLDLKRRGYPHGDYTILCFNCNLARGFFGYCPHEKEMAAW